MIVWGGTPSSLSNAILLNSGARYSPTSNTWTALPTADSPSARTGHTAVWTGDGMIIWGGTVGPNTHTNTGGKYTPVTNAWAALPAAGAPAARASHSAVWTGTAMIVWGGFTLSSSPPLLPGLPSGLPMVQDTGGRYTPGNNTWAATSAVGTPSARALHSAVWTGETMLVWGGLDLASGFASTGSRYNPTTNSWAPTGAAGAPTGRTGQSAIWTGDEMIIWGGGSTAVQANGGRLGFLSYYRKN